MNDVPRLFAESVARLFDDDALSSLTESRSGLFRTVGHSLWEKRLYVTLNVVYNSEAGTFAYCLTSSLDCTYMSSATPYTYNPADHRFVFKFKVKLFDKKTSLHCVDGVVIWTTATPTDPTFLNLLRAPFARTELCLKANCPELLKLLPDYCTFNCINAYGVFNHSELLYEIIQRSQACGRLEHVHCIKFFKTRLAEALIDWISTNKRLKWITCFDSKNPFCVRSVLNITVQ